MTSGIAASRLQKEISMLEKDPPPGACAAPVDGNLFKLEAQLQGPPGSVYEGGVFHLTIDIPSRYPIEPPQVRFKTQIYHPNIDSDGRICLDILVPPPKGQWKPSQNIATVLVSLGLLLSEPNPDDGLVADITEEYKHRRDVFNEKAKRLTKQHASQCIETNKGEKKETTQGVGNASVKSCESDRPRCTLKEKNLSSRNQDSPTAPKSKKLKAEIKGT